MWSYSQASRKVTADSYPETIGENACYIFPLVHICITDITTSDGLISQEITVEMPTAPTTPESCSPAESESDSDENECFEPVDIKPLPVEKHIHFSPLVSVVLIPCLNEYREANLLPTLFWSMRDLKLFRTELLQSLQQFMLKLPAGTDKKAALKVMLADEHAQA